MLSTTPYCEADADR